MYKISDVIKVFVRSVMRTIATVINKISGGKISPNLITIVGLLAHIPIAVLIAQGSLGLAAILLVFFGLFDTLDGELARLQKKDSASGMVLDSVTDRIKEVMLYTGVTYYFVDNSLAIYAVWATVAIGGSLLGSYVQAKGDIALDQAKKARGPVNKKFRGGLLPFEIRMFLLIIGLLFSALPTVTIAVAMLSWATVLQRLNWVIRALK